MMKELFDNPYKKIEDIPEEIPHVPYEPPGGELRIGADGLYVFDKE